MLREWARNAPAVRAALNSADEDRIEFVAGQFRSMGLDAGDAHERATRMISMFIRMIQISGIGDSIRNFQPDCLGLLAKEPEKNPPIGRKNSQVPIRTKH